METNEFSPEEQEFLKKLQISFNSWIPGQESWKKQNLERLDRELAMNASEKKQSIVMGNWIETIGDLIPFVKAWYGSSTVPNRSFFVAVDRECFARIMGSLSNLTAAKNAFKIVHEEQYIRFNHHCGWTFEIAWFSHVKKGSITIEEVFKSQTENTNDKV